MLRDAEHILATDPHLSRPCRERTFPIRPRPLPAPLICWLMMALRRRVEQLSHCDHAVQHWGSSHFQAEIADLQFNVEDPRNFPADVHASDTVIGQGL